MSDRSQKLLQKAVTALSQNDGRKVVDLCQKILKRDEPTFDVLHLLGIGYRLLGQLSRARQHYLEALKINPEGSAPLFCNLSFAYLEDSEFNCFKAEEYADRAREADPGLAECYEVSAAVYIRVGDQFRAEHWLKEALHIEPNNPNVLARLAQLYANAGRFVEAHEVIFRALETAPSEFGVLAARADVFDKEGQTQKALDDYEAAKLVSPDKANEINEHILAILQTHGQAKRLQELATNLIDKYPKSIAGHLALVRNGQYPGGVETAAKKIRKLSNKERLTELSLFAIAAGYEREENDVESFKYLKRANAYKSRNSSYRVSTTKDFYQRLKEHFSNVAFPPVDLTTSVPDVKPVFIVGMPRSGTSLTEQLLGTHSEITPLGELIYLPRLINFGLREYEHKPQQRKPEYWNWVRETYLRSVEAINEDAKYVIDKLPHNYENIGFISRLFPEAHIIHCRRDPISTCLSIYKTNFAGHHPYAQDMQNLGRYYGFYEDLMRFWQGMQIEWQECVYEGLVQDMRMVVTGLLESLDLAWEDEIEQFHKSDRIVRTSSNDQVRQPIYQSSVKSWKRYEEQLQPLIHELLEAGAITEDDLA